MRDHFDEPHQPRTIVDVINAATTRLVYYALALSFGAFSPSLFVFALLAIFDIEVAQADKVILATLCGITGVFCMIPAYCFAAELLSRVEEKLYG